MKRSNRFAVCVNDAGALGSLEVRKIYRVLDDAEAEAHGLLRVNDESEEDYLFPATCFVPVEVPKAAVRLFSKRSA
jgi:hypothetical protein